MNATSASIATVTVIAVGAAVAFFGSQKSRAEEKLDSALPLVGNGKKMEMPLALPELKSMYIRD